MNVPNDAAAAPANIYDFIAPVYWDVYDDMKAGGHGEYWLKGGRGSGKSSFAAFAILRGILADPAANAVVYRRVALTLRDSVYASFCRAAEMLGIAPLFRFGKSPLEIEYLCTGQKILFRGADDPLKSKSIAVKKGYFKYLWFEETAEFKGEEDLRSIIQSVMRGSDEGIVICTYNPPRSARAWINAAGTLDVPGRLTLTTTYLDMPRAWLGRRFLSEARALKQTNERAYRNEYLGEVTGSGGQVFDNLEIRTLSDEELSSLEIRYRGLDFGFAADPDAYTEWAFDRKKRVLYALSELVSPGMSAQTLAEEVKRRAGRAGVVCDSAEPRLIAELKAQGVNARGAKKGPGSREHGYRWLQTLSRIVIDSARTPHIFLEMSAYEYPRAADGGFINVYPDGNDHTLDSARYALEACMTERRAKTQKDIY